MRPSSDEMGDTSAPERTNVTLIFYTRAGCHLCDVAKNELDHLQSRIGFRIEVRDVDADEAWAKQFGDEVPVGVVDGQKVFKYRVDVKHLERALRARGA